MLILRVAIAATAVVLLSAPAHAGSASNLGQPRVAPPVASSGAADGGVLLRSATLPSRGRAARVARAGRELGLRPVVDHVARRPGESTWVVRLRGAASVADARRLADALSAATGTSHAVVGAATLPRVDLEPVTTGLEGVAPMVHPVSRATLVDAPSVVFRFERTTPDGVRVRHDYQRDGDATFLEIDVLQGNGRDSRMYLGPDTASVSIGGGPWRRTDVDEVRAVVERFAPEAVLGALVDLPTERLAPLNPGSGADGLVWAAAPPAPGEAALRVGHDPVTGRVRQLVVGPSDGEIVWTLEGTAPGSAEAPELIRATLGGTDVDQVRVDVLDLRPSLSMPGFPGRGS